MTIADIMWRGPRPLTPGYLLKGRDSELSQLVDIARTFDVFEITAPSGVGKSSFIAAGLVPALEYDYKTVLPSGPTSWGKVIHEYDRLAAGAIDAELLYRLYLGFAVDSGMDLSEHFANFGGEVVVILDQFEELIRYRDKLGAAVLKFVGRTAQSNGVTHIVAARSEYRDQLRPLEDSARQRFFHWALKEIDDRHAIEEIVGEPVKAAGLTIEPEATEDLGVWWEKAREATDDDDEHRGTPGVTIGLLHLQGTLWQFKRWLLKHDPDTTCITRSHLHAFAMNADWPGIEAPQPDDETAQSDDEVAKPTIDVAGPALFRNGLVEYIAEHCEQLHLPLADGVPWSPAERDGRLTWTNGPRLMLARSANLLSVLGYKVAQSRSGMFQSVLAEDLDPRLARLLATGVIRHEQLSHQDGSDVLRDTAEELAASKENARGTGVAAGWTSAQVFHELMAAAAQAWEAASLPEVNILRKFVQADDDVFELVHDGMGPALQQWAAQVLDQARSALGVITPRVGQEVVTRLAPDTFLTQGTIPHYWQGMVELADTDDTAGADDTNESVRVSGLGWDASLVLSEMQDVVLDNCTLTGALFLGNLGRDDKTPRRIANVVFRRCNLRGAAFHNIVFDKVRFEGCNLHGAAIRFSELGDVTFCRTAAGPEPEEDFETLDLLSFVKCSATGDGVQLDHLEDTLGIVLKDVSGGPWTVSGDRVRHIAVDAAGPIQIRFAPGTYEHVTIRGDQVTLTADDGAIIEYSEDIARLREPG